MSRKTKFLLAIKPTAERGRSSSQGFDRGFLMLHQAIFTMLRKRSAEHPHVRRGGAFLFETSINI
ncbi:hypothetical protein CF651_13580 [Paenibacillus rigui]|uniref:Uncharacterized protein n=1 Tax=Paenibacillus rigui TaxID=554312 RepID=A0A229UQM9_9BACL|nr:hypothetical protein CF651_13580 [Paenibacillus rigui]